jgi:Holliday junction DNA helicase RuvB
MGSASTAPTGAICADLAETYQGGPAGLETLSAALSEARDALEEVIEPFLLQQGFIQRTPRGRLLTRAAWAHLGLAAPELPGQPGLFEEGG